MLRCEIDMAAEQGRENAATSDNNDDGTGTNNLSSNIQEVC